METGSQMMAGNWKDATKLINLYLLIQKMNGHGGNESPFVYV